MSAASNASPHRRASVLLVDDRRDKLLALEAVLSDLDVDLVKADSGAEALRCVLKQDFAAILLDVNMPAMDGFETAALIRARPNSERTPILFVTAYSEDLYVTRGYSLGAVDYIVAPIVPEVLRTKVSVFVDLFNALEQQRRHADATSRHAARLQHLTRASQTINSRASIDDILDAALEAAHGILAGDVCAAGMPSGQGVRTRQRGGLRLGAVTEAQLRAVVETHARDFARAGSVLRVPAPVSSAPDGAAAETFPRVECLLTPLVGHGGRHLGVLCTADRADGGTFDADDEAIFLQLGQTTGIAIENLLFAQEQEANKLKEEFLLTLSHELRTPLTAIVGWINLLKKGRLDAAGTARAVEVIERNAKLQSKLIDDLLDISRIAAGKLQLSVQPVALQDLLTKTVDAARPMAEAKELMLDVVVPNDVDTIHGDVDRLQQVLWNLLTNAIKFTMPGGSVRVRLEQRGKWLGIDVRDTGRGIAPDFLPYVFERFRQADAGSTRTSGGLGIGLAVVRHIVELHGGSVEASSDGEDHGATFTVLLPAQERAAEPGPPPATWNGASGVDSRLDGLQGVRVMVVDDQLDVRRLLDILLAERGMEVRTVDSAAAAMKALAEFRPDLLISDIAMPGEDGWSLIVRVRECRPSGTLPVIALSAYASELDRARSRMAGFDAHVAKPIDTDELLAMIVSLVAPVRATSAVAVSDATLGPADPADPASASASADDDRARRR